MVTVLHLFMVSSVDAYQEVKQGLEPHTTLRPCKLAKAQLGPASSLSTTPCQDRSGLRGTSDSMRPVNLSAGAAAALALALSALLMRLLPQLSGPLPPLAPPILRSQLPAERPLQPWPYRQLHSAQWSLERLPRGALRMVLHHVPVPHINTSMLHWWFDGNVEGDAVHPVTGKMTPKYLIWHPRDHVRQVTVFASSTGGHGEGAYWSIQEYFLAPEPGPTRSGHAMPWAEAMAVNALVRVARLDSSGLTIAAQLGPHLPAAFTQTVVWRDVHISNGHQQDETSASSGSSSGREGGSNGRDGSSIGREGRSSSNGRQVNRSGTAQDGDEQGGIEGHAAAGRGERAGSIGVSITTHIQIGFDALPGVPAMLTQAANALVRLVFGGSDAEGVAAAYATHSVEEYGNMQHFLPQLFGAAHR